MIKICTDCKYYKPGWHYDWCYHPSLPYSVVDGVVNAQRCQGMRGYYGTCGEEAKLYEPSRYTRFLQFFKPAPKVQNYGL